MDALAHQALNYETLVATLGNSEVKAGSAFEAITRLGLAAEPLPLHSKAYASVIGGADQDLTDVYYRFRPYYEQLDDKTLILDWNSPQWPKQIDSFIYRPRFLYVQGNAGLLRQNSVSVIGSRSPSLEGRQRAVTTAQELGKASYVVASGLALGIDGAAHKGALAAGYPTIAVIGTPISQSYPPEHAGLQAEIAKTGVVVSRFAPSASTQKWFFLLRNRLMSALSLASVIVEDRDGGGAVRQATFALEQKKYIFLYQDSVDNHAIHWPLQFADRPRVFIAKASKDIPRILLKAMKTKTSIPQKATQLDLFSL